MNISLLFMAVDILGGGFSILSRLFRSEFNIAPSSYHVTVRINIS